MKKYIGIHEHSEGLTVYYFQTGIEIHPHTLNSEETHNKLIDLLAIPFASAEYCDDNESLVVEEVPDLETIPTV